MERVFWIWFSVVGIRFCLVFVDVVKHFTNIYIYIYIYLFIDLFIYFYLIYYLFLLLNYDYYSDYYYCLVLAQQIGILGARA